MAKKRDTFSGSVTSKLTSRLNIFTDSVTLKDDIDSNMSLRELHTPNRTTK